MPIDRRGERRYLFTTFDFYRIQLNDPAILTTARQERLDRDLYPFLVYILMHEMVHLVRPSNKLAGAGDFPLSVEAEEDRVQRVAYRNLAIAPDQRLRPVPSKFCASP
jgi:hypothetical protein